MTEDDPGMHALQTAARLEAARVYGQYSPEYRPDPKSMAEEVQHFAGFGWSAARIALRLRTTKGEVYRLLGGAA